MMIDCATHAVALVPGGAFVDGALAGLAGRGEAIVLRHMRRHVHGAKIGDMIGRVIRLVLTGRNAAAGSLAPGLEHDLRGAALSGSGGLRCNAGPPQPLPVLHCGGAHIAGLRPPPGGLAIEPAVGVGRTRMGIVLALLSMEVGATVVVTAAVLGAKALL